MELKQLKQGQNITVNLKRAPKEWIAEAGEDNAYDTSGSLQYLDTIGVTLMEDSGAIVIVPWHNILTVDWVPEE